MVGGATGLAPVHGGILLAAFVVTGMLGPIRWPCYLLLPLLAYGVVIVLVGPLRRSVPRFSVGRIGGPGALAAVALSLLTAGVLLLYETLFQPDVRDLTAQLPMSAFGNVLLAGAWFSVANAVLEELIFRGVFYEALAAEWGAVVAVLASAALFGLGHMQGYPPGMAGAVLAALYGVALGLMRWYTGGLGLVIACHVSADATIFAILAGAASLVED